MNLHSVRIDGSGVAEADRSELGAHRVHPDLEPGLARLERLGVTARRFDIQTDDDPSLLS